MAKFYVFFVTIDADKINNDPHGWNSLDGKAYLNATMHANPTDALVRSLYKPAAVVNAPGHQLDAEQVWTTLQNINASWKEREGVICLTDQPRSSMTGDIIYDVDADQWAIVASIGFDPVWQERDIDLLNAVLDTAKRAEHEITG